MLRKMQADFKDVVDGIKDGSGVKVVHLLGTPGAGKSAIPIQACELIKAGLADAIAWFVPRSALQNQGEHGFIDTFFMELFNHNFQIRESTNEFNPCRGTNGFVTTYQAIGVDTKKTVLNEVKSKRYIIILDEFHHLEKNGVWHEAINKIVMAGHFLILMTGTLGRGDKKEIAYVDYKKKLPYFKNCGDEALIIYSRIDALKEKAILPIEFHLSDGSFEWAKANGQHHSVESFKRAFTPQQKSEALFTAINSDFAADLLKNCVLSWQAEKKKNRNAKLLIVTAGRKQAEDALFMLKRGCGIDAEIAISHESKAAILSIKRFKSGQCNILVTIAMAYEGLDVPGVTHICVLTNIRSREWIEQMLARGVRVDKHPAAGPYKRQKCYVFAPMDQQFGKVVDLIRKQQVSAIDSLAKVKEENEPEEQDEEEQKKALRNLIVYYINSYCLYNKCSAEQINYELKRHFGISRTIMTLKDLKAVMQYLIKNYPLKKNSSITPISGELTGKNSFLMGIDENDTNVKGWTAANNIPVMTVKEQETLIRQTIHSHVNRYCFDNRYRQERINHELKIKFGKARRFMTLPELKTLQKYLMNHYPIEMIETIKDIYGISSPRAKRKRVSNKVMPFSGSSDIIKQSSYNLFDYIEAKKC